VATPPQLGDRRGHDPVVVGFTNTYQFVGSVALYEGQNISLHENGGNVSNILKTLFMLYIGLYDII
jgi:hypothetical protein